ncbi:hypothetical protein HYV86_05210 [Candidatus Woesearchaeota archaeon]|nr:hypothetical protein [Candidatus Woesearchaeota archaeon]
MFITHFPDRAATASIDDLYSTAVRCTTQLYTLTQPRLAHFLDSRYGSLSFDGRGREQVGNEDIITARLHLPDRLVNGDIGLHSDVNIFVERISYLAFSSYIGFYFSKVQASSGEIKVTAQELTLLNKFGHAREVFWYLADEWDSRNGKGGKLAKAPHRLLQTPDLSF